ncbi:MAG TPA: hypothetical protein DCL32_08450 [Gammaproteobacteria bacterium]|nr:hypothetical protein [Gammaproteobacteria bacterium]
MAFEFLAGLRPTRICSFELFQNTIWRSFLAIGGQFMPDPNKCGGVSLIGRTPGQGLVCRVFR